MRLPHARVDPALPSGEDAGAPPVGIGVALLIGVTADAAAWSGTAVGFAAFGLGAATVDLTTILSQLHPVFHLGQELGYCLPLPFLIASLPQSDEANRECR